MQVKSLSALQIEHVISRAMHFASTVEADLPGSNFVWSTACPEVSWSYSVPLGSKAACFQFTMHCNYLLIRTVFKRAKTEHSLICPMMHFANIY